MKAIVLVKFTSLENRDGYNHLRSLKAVSESYMIYGRYDAVAFLEASSLEEIRHITLSQIQSIPGVIETMPCLIVEEQAPLQHGASTGNHSLDGASVRGQDFAR